MLSLIALNSAAKVETVLKQPKRPNCMPVTIVSQLLVFTNILVEASAAMTQAAETFAIRVPNGIQFSKPVVPNPRRRNENGSLYPQHSSASTNLEPQPKKKRSLPGHPDPEAEVIALTPQTLLATNRFICEICNKGFQRDQNLQLHRRGHNLPWKLKKRNSKETPRRKVYVCPEATCVHHDPSRALGDLTGIKKHFFRKHGEKKWKCEKCSKRYAVQSDWKAHSKICGTREYKCDCGTIFSRRDSFITHRAFCDALAQESARTVTEAVNPPVLSSQSHTQFHSQYGFQLAPPSVKKELQDINISRPSDPHIIPSWLACSSYSSVPPLVLPNPTHLDQSSLGVHREIENPNSFNNHSFISPHIMSATALLQKASQTAPYSPSIMPRSVPPPHLMMHHHHHVQVQQPECTAAALYNSSSSSNSAVSSGIIMGSSGFSHCLASYNGNNKAAIFNTETDQPSSLLHHDDMMGSGFNPQNNNFEEFDSKSTQSQVVSKSSNIKGGGGGAIISEEMTRDFLSLGAAFSQRDHQYLFNMSASDGLDYPLGSLSYGKPNQNQAPWPG